MKRRRGCGFSVLVLLLIAAVAVGVDYGVDYLLFAPWAYGFLGGQTLTGSWEGSMTTHSGVRYVVYLQLNRDRSDRGTPLNTRGQADIEGPISWCARAIPSTITTIYGHANRSASKVVFETSELRHPPPGLFPIHFQGAWHGSSLNLHVLFYLVRNHGYVYSSAIPDDVRPVTLTMHKRGYSAYEAACAHV